MTMDNDTVVQPADQKAVEPQKHVSIAGRIQTEPRLIRYCDLEVAPDDWAFREDGELQTHGDTPLHDLVESIKPRGNIHTPMLVKPHGDGKYLVLDGHRRYFALGILIDEGIEGFHAEMLIPTNVVVSDNSEGDLVLLTIEGNVKRNAPTAEGRMRGVRRAHQTGVPLKDIADVYGIGVSTVQRDLAVSSDEEVMKQVRENHISYTDAAALIKLALDKNRLPEFKQAFQSWLDEVLEQLWVEERKRLARDQESLNPVDFQAKKHLSRAQVAAWREALEKGEPFGKPTFKFRALLDDGVIKLDGLSKPVDDMTAEDLVKVLVRLTDLADEIEPILKQKVEREQQTVQAEAAAERPSAGLERLKALGLERFAQSLTPASAAPDVGEDETLSVFTPVAEGADGPSPDADDIAANGGEPAGDVAEVTDREPQHVANDAAANPVNVPEPELTEAARNIQPSPPKSGADQGRSPGTTGQGDVS